MPGGEAAIVKGLAESAHDALGDVGAALGDFVRGAADTADRTTDEMVATEARNTQRIADIASRRAASVDSAAGVREGCGPAGGPSKFSAVLDPRGAGAAGAAGWRGEGGLRLTPQEDAAAVRFLAQARDAETRISPMILEIRDRVPGAQALGYPRFVLKDPDSFKRKLATVLAESPSRDLGHALAAVKDSVRYTLKFPGEGSAYTDGVTAAIGHLGDAGCQPVALHNTWGSGAYQGVNSFWRDPETGHVFEVQFHTQESFDAKMVTHGLYEQARLPGLDAAAVQRLRAAQNRIFGTVPRPDGAGDVKLTGR